MFISWYKLYIYIYIYHIYIFFLGIKKIWTKSIKHFDGVLFLQKTKQEQILIFDDKLL